MNIPMLTPPEHEQQASRKFPAEIIDIAWTRKGEVSSGVARLVASVKQSGVLHHAYSPIDTAPTKQDLHESVKFQPVPESEEVHANMNQQQPEAATSNNPLISETGAYHNQALAQNQLPQTPDMPISALDISSAQQRVQAAHDSNAMQDDWQQWEDESGWSGNA